VENLVNVWAIRDRGSYPRIVLEQIDMVKQGVAKTLGGVRIVCADIVENDLKID
jgi:hypothetical protein